MRAARVLFLVGATAAFGADAPGGPRAALPFTEDDYPRAMKQAQSKKLPIFVEAWAPW